MAVSSDIVELIRHQAKLCPERTALVSEDEEITYGQLVERMDGVSGGLQELGVSQGDRVVMAVDRSPQTFVVILGVLQLGAAYCPLSPHEPRKRAADLVRELDPSLIITEDGAPFGEGATTALSAVRVAEFARRPMVHPSHPAYVIHTSGSSGSPRGVVVPRRAVSNLAVAQGELFGISPGSRVGQFAPLTFDASVAEWATTLCNGGALRVLAGNGAEIGTGLLDALEDDALDVLTLPPSVASSVPIQLLGSLNTLVLAGERCQELLLTALLESSSGPERVMNAYGPTEAGVCATVHCCDLRYPASTIGRPISGVGLQICDDHFEPTAEGETGEIVIDGVGLALEILGVDRSEAGLVTNPLTGRSCYRSGDLARWLPDGVIEFIGRRDRQQKRRGVRISLEEIEKNLATLAGVDGIAVVRPENASQNELVAVYTGSRSPDSLAEESHRILPGHLQPDRFVHTEELTLTPHGKVDLGHASRIAANGEASRSDGSTKKAASATTQRIGALMAEVLGLEELGPTDDFFQLGGDSLKCLRLIGLSKGQGLSLTIADVFENPSPAALTAAIEGRDDSGADSTATVNIVVDGREVPCTPEQKALFAKAEWEQNPISLINTLIFRWRGTLRRDALVRAIGETINRRKELRARLVSTRPPLMMYAAPRGSEASIETIHAPEVATGERTSYLLREGRRQRSATFDLTLEPPCRWSVLQFDEQDHGLILSFHHAFLDDRGVGSVWRDISREYSRLTSGVGLPTSISEGRPIGLLEYASLIAEEDQKNRQSEDWWRVQLKSSCRMWPEIGHRGRRFSQPVGLITIDLPTEFASSLEQASSKTGVTSTTFSLAILANLSSGWTGEGAPLIGLPASTRQDEAFVDSVGYFVELLPFTFEVDSTSDVSKLAKSVQRRLLDFQAHLPCPPSVLVRDGEYVGPELVFDLQRPDSALGELGELPCERLDLAPESARFPVSIALVIEKERAFLAIEFDGSKIVEKRIRSFGCAFAEALKLAVEDPAGPLTKMPTLSLDEQQRILAISVSKENPKFLDPVSALDSYTDLDPAYPALVSWNDRISREQVRDRSNAIAAVLQSNGVSPGDVVALAMDRGLTAILAIIGIMKTGAAWAYAGPSLGQVNQLKLMRSVMPKAVLYEKETDIFEAGTDCPWISIVRSSAGERFNAPELGSQPVLAYVVSTSGSTGDPKFVAVERMGLMALAGYLETAFELYPDDGILQFAPLNTDASVWDLLLFMTTGARLHVAGDGSQVVPDIERFLDSDAISLATLPPSLARSIDRETLAKARIVVLAGERCDRTLTDSLAGRVQLFNAYGPSEATVCATISRFDPGKPPATIGRPLPGRAAFVLDEWMRSTPPGTAGNLWLGGIGLARGYLNDAESTQELFVEVNRDRFGVSRLYDTGDRVRVLDSGEIEFLGRADRQIKRRGHRIEPAAIDHVLESHTGVAHVYTAFDATIGLITAWAPVEADSKLSEQELAGIIRERLGSTPVPDRLVRVDTIPLLPNGKADAKAVLRLASRRSDEREARTPDSFTALAEIWRRELGLDSVNADDIFFELGGDSLSAMRMVAAAQKVGIQISLDDVFANTPLGQLAPIGDEETTASQVIPQIGKATAAQLAFVLQADLLPEAALQNTVLALSFEPPLDLGLLRDSLSDIVAHQPSLRTGFHRVGDRVDQKVESSAPSVLEVRTHPEGATDPAIQDVARRAARIPIEVDSPPLWRAIAICREQSVQGLVMIFHHAIVDGSSLGILLRQLDAAYSARLSGTLPIFAKLEVTPTILAAREAEYLESESVSNTIQQFTAELEGYRAFARFPTTHERSKGASSVESQRILRRLSRANFEGANRLRMPELLSAIAELGRRLTGRSQIGLAVPTSLREEDSVDHLIAPCLNLVPVILELEGGIPLEARMEQARKDWVRAFKHRKIPFEKLIPDASVQSAFQILVNIPDRNPERISIGPSQGALVAVDIGMARFDLCISVLESETGGLELAIDYRTSVFVEETVNQWADCLACLLEGHPLTVSPASAPRIAEIEGEDFFNRIFDRMVDSDVIALRSSKGETLSYGELFERVNDCVSTIKEVTSPGSLVSLRARPSIALVVGFLATIRSGRLVAPLDPSIPAAKCEEMVPDAMLHLTNEPSVDATWMQFDHQEDLGYRLGSERGEWSAPEALYAIHTSGTSGRPKRVVVGATSLVNYLQWFIAEVGVTQGDESVLFGSVAYDLNLTALLVPLCAGATLDFLPCEESVSDLLDYLEYPRHLRFLKLTPSHVKWLAASGVRRRLTASCDVLVLGGECLLPDTLNLARLMFPNSRILNEYGPTEATIACTFEDVAASVEQSRPLPIGSPIPGAKVAVVDKEKLICPVGGVGELWVGGDCLGLGYGNQLGEIMCSEGFGAEGPRRCVGVPAEEGRWYRTGDHAMVLPGDRFLVMGRLDGVVKINGFRIDLTEIENALAMLPGISSAVVRPVVTEKETKLAAAVVWESSSPPDSLQIRNFLRDRFPRSMIPAEIRFLMESPHASSGKLDRDRLWKLAVAPKANFDTNTRSLSETERRVLELWQQEIGSERISPEDDFFDMGGTSFGLARVLLQVRKELGSEIKLTDFFQNPTVRALASLIDHGSVGTPQTVDWAEETRLPSGIRFAGPGRKIQEGAILITGATGAIGHLVLKELLENTEREIYCLVRNHSGRPACGGLVGVDPSRIRILKGGLEDLIRGEFDSELEQVSQVVHLAANVNHVATYRSLRSSSVLPIRHLVDLAKQRPVRIDYVSSLAAGISENDLTSIRESLPRDQSPSRFAGGYAQSKWAVERLLSQAVSAGASVVCYRLTSAIGHESTPDSDHLAALISACARYGVAPDTPLRVDPIPIDLAAKLVATGVLEPVPTENVYNLTPEVSPDWISIVKRLSQTFGPIELLPPKVWRERLAELISEEDPLFPLLALYLGDDPALRDHIETIQRIPVERRHGIALAAKSGVHWPSADQLIELIVAAQRRRAEVTEPEAGTP